MTNAVGIKKKKNTRTTENKARTLKHRGTSPEGQSGLSRFKLGVVGFQRKKKKIDVVFRGIPCRQQHIKVCCFAGRWKGHHRRTVLYTSFDNDATIRRLQKENGALDHGRNNVNI